MARSASSSITIFDVVDGTEPIVAFQTNPAHTFKAASDGAVTAAELNGFSDLVYCYIGENKAEASTDTSDADMPNSSFRLSDGSGNGDPITVTGSGWPGGSNWTVSAETDEALKLTAPSSALADSSADTASATLHIRIKNAAGTISTVDQDINFTKALAGGDTNVITVTGTDNVFTANSSGTLDAGQNDIVVDIETQGSPGTQTYEVSVNGGSFNSRTTTANTAGQISAYRDSGDTEDQTGTISGSATQIIISQGNLGNTNDTYQLRVSGADGGSDVYNVVKIKTGVDAENAIVVNISSDNGDVFSSNNTSDKTLTARVYDQSTGTEITTGLTYDWRLGGPNSSTKVQVDGSNNVVTSGGSDATGAFIIVGDEDVNQDQQYSCIVNVT